MSDYQPHTNVYLFVQDTYDPQLYAYTQQGTTISLPHMTYVDVVHLNLDQSVLSASMAAGLDGQPWHFCTLLHETTGDTTVIFRMRCSIQCSTINQFQWTRADTPFSQCCDGLKMSRATRLVLRTVHDILLNDSSLDVLSLSHGQLWVA